MFQGGCWIVSGLIHGLTHGLIHGLLLGLLQGCHAIHDKCTYPPPRRYLFGFIATSEKARDTLLGEIKRNKWGLNVYRHQGAFRPAARPASADLRKHGVTAWLDGASLQWPCDRAE